MKPSKDTMEMLEKADDLIAMMIGDYLKNNREGMDVKNSGLIQLCIKADDEEFLRKVEGKLRSINGKCLEEIEDGHFPANRLRALVYEAPNPIFNTLLGC